MKEIQLTQGQAALVDDENYEFLNQWRWYAQKSNNTFYAARGEYKSQSKTSDTIFMHREILKISDSKKIIDHIDHNGLNNQRDNLRIVTHRQNSANMKPHKNSVSKYKGVYREQNKWRVRIRTPKKTLSFGYYHSEEFAALVYNEKAKEIYGEFAYLNKMTG